MVMGNYWDKLSSERSKITQQSSQVVFVNAQNSDPAVETFCLLESQVIREEPNNKQIPIILLNIRWESKQEPQSLSQKALRVILEEAE